MNLPGSLLSRVIAATSQPGIGCASTAYMFPDSSVDRVAGMITHPFNMPQRSESSMYNRHQDRFRLNPSVHVKHLSSLRHQARALQLSAAGTLKYIASDYMARVPIAEHTWLIRMDRYTVPLRCNGTDARILAEVFGDVYRYDSASPVRRILDLGANIGLSALYFNRAYPDATIACVEASPKNATLLARTISLNRLPARIIQAAIGVDNGTATFWDTKDPSCSTLIQDQRAAAASQITVPQITVDSVMAQMGWDALDLVKIDIEGYERFLLKQKAEWLGKTAAIVGEIHEGYSFHELSSDLHPFGFTVTERSRNEVYGMANFVAVRNSAREVVSLPKFF